MARHQFLIGQPAFTSTFHATNPTCAMSTLALKTVTQDAFAPFGTVVTSRERSGRRINAGTSMRVDLPDPDLLAEDGRPALAVFHARAAALPFTVRALERHPLGSQTFVPLAGTPFAVVVALGDARPDPATLRAFRVDGNQGVTFARGVWHHPLIALAAGDFVVLERRGEAPDCEVAAIPETLVAER